MAETILDELSGDLVATLRKLALDGQRRTDARRELHLEGVPYDNSAERSANREIKERLAQVNPFLARVIERLYDVEKQFLPHVIPEDDPKEDAALDIIEKVASIKLPRALRDFYTKIGDGGVGPGLGIYSTGDLLERYRWSVFDHVGPQGQQWPKHLLPMWGDDWDCVSIDLATGNLIKWEVGLLQIELASGERGRWGYSFNWVAASLEDWMRKWLEDIGMPLPSEPDNEAVSRNSAPAACPKPSGSGNYLARYNKGECEAVWSELMELGDAVIDESLRSEAEGVARETMSRARRNIEKIVHRLDGMGYRFGNDASGPFPAEDARVFMGAPADAPQLIDRLESELGGPLPLSLRAFYEQVGGVSLIGFHELLNPPYRGQQDLADPLLLFGIEDLIEQLDEIPAKEREDETELMIAPDDLTKADVSGSFYYVYLPCAAADFAFSHFRSGSFVDYLRLTFKWGGFPGWDRCSNPPTAQIAILTEDLERI